MLLMDRTRTNNAMINESSSYDEILVENADNINSRFGCLNYMPHNSLRLVLNNRMHPSSSITNPKKKKKKNETHHGQYKN